MSDVKFTQMGDWSIERHGDAYALYSGRDDSHHGARLMNLDDGDNNFEANAHLIAAAPCMDRELGAVYEFLLNLRDDSDDPVLRTKAQERINAIVDVREKARGKA